MRGRKWVKGRNPLLGQAFCLWQKRASPALRSRVPEGRALRPERFFRGEKMFDFVCFSWIVLCFLLSFTGGMPLAAGLTLCADFFLIYTTHYATGLAFFILVQLAYLQNFREMPFRLWYTAIFPLAYLLPLPVLGGIYALLFFCHFYFAIKKAGTCRSVFAMLYVLALVLFAACDITVAWGYFAQPAPETVWLFYAPSQFLLALTARAWQLPQRFFHQRKGRKALPSHQAKP